MRILFDIELDGHPETDSQLLDVLFSYKREILKSLENAAQQIDSENGVIVISFPKGHYMDIKYCCLTESVNKGLIEPIIENINYKRLLDDIGNSRKN